MGPTEPGFAVRDIDDTVTVASGVEDVMAAVGAGLVDDDQAVVVRGETGGTSRPTSWATVPPS